MIEDALRIRHAWRAAMIAGVLNLVGMGFALVIGRTVPGMPWWPPLTAAAIGASLIGLLSLRRHTPTLRSAGLAFVLNTAAIVLVLAISFDHFQSSGVPWNPYQGAKLAVLVVALIAPELIPGLLSIAAYTTVALVHLALLEPVPRSRIPLGEPWILLGIGVLAVIVFLFRRRGLDNERRASRSAIEAAALDRFARVALAIRDLANTPLQTLQIGVDLLRVRPENPGPVLDRLGAALATLHELDAVLAPYAKDVHWRPDDTAFDAKSLIQRVEASRRISDPSG